MTKPSDVIFVTREQLEEAQWGMWKHGVHVPTSVEWTSWYARGRFILVSDSEWVRHVGNGSFVLIHTQTFMIRSPKTGETAPFQAIPNGGE